MGIVDPDRPAQPKRHRLDPLPVAGDEMELRVDQFGHAVRRQRPFEDRDAGDVHVRDAILEIEKFRIKSTQSVHRITSARSSPLCAPSDATPHFPWYLMQQDLRLYV